MVVERLGNFVADDVAQCNTEHPTAFRSPDSPRRCLELADKRLYLQPISGFRKSSAFIALLTAIVPGTGCGLRGPPECCGLGRFFDAFSHFLARLEMRDIFREDGHGFAGLWVATFPCRAVIHAETSEAADFDAITMSQRITNSVEDFLDDDFGILGRQMGETGGKCGDEV